MARTDTMHEDQRKLVTRLFAEACACLEDAHQIAMKGQAPGKGARTYGRQAEQLAKAMADLQTLAEAIMAITRRSER